MKKLACLLAGVLLISGCSMQPKEKVPLPQLENLNQTCSGNKECDFIWSHVPEKIELITRMRVDNVSALFISTYAPSGDRFLGGSVKLVSLKNGKKEIQSAFHCQRFMDEYDCSRLQISATDLFNLMMKNVKADYNK